MTLPQAFLTRPIAHRALHGAGRPENSLAAIDAAIHHGYGIELDTQPAQCGTPMVFHDYILDRLTGQSGSIAHTPRAELQAMRLMGTDQTIPTLAQVLDHVAGRVPILLEVKDQDGTLGPDTRGFETRVIDMIADYTGPLALMSFNPHSTRALKSLRPDLPCGHVTCAFDAQSWPHLPAQRRAELASLDHLQDDIDFISHQHSDLDRPQVAQFAQSRPVLCWTIRSTDEERAARRFAQNVTFEDYLAEDYPA